MEGELTKNEKKRKVEEIGLNLDENLIPSESPTKKRRKVKEGNFQEILKKFENATKNHKTSSNNERNFVYYFFEALRTKPNYQEIIDKPKLNNSRTEAFEFYFQLKGEDLNQNVENFISKWREQQRNIYSKKFEAMCSLFFIGQTLIDGKTTQATNEEKNQINKVLTIFEQTDYKTGKCDFNPKERNEEDENVMNKLFSIGYFQNLIEKDIRIMDLELLDHFSTIKNKVRSNYHENNRKNTTKLLDGYLTRFYTTSDEVFRTKYSQISEETNQIEKEINKQEYLMRKYANDYKNVEFAHSFMMGLKKVLEMQVLADTKIKWKLLRAIFHAENKFMIDSLNLMYTLQFTLENSENKTRELQINKENNDEDYIIFYFSSQLEPKYLKKLKKIIPNNKRKPTGHHTITTIQRNQFTNNSKIGMGLWKRLFSQLYSFFSLSFLRKIENEQDKEKKTLELKKEPKNTKQDLENNEVVIVIE